MSTRTFRILRQFRSHNRPVQQYVMDHGRVVIFPNRVAAEVEAARLRHEVFDQPIIHTVVENRH